ncbi:hypothetical protein SALCHL_000061 [Streptomyces albus subsp. chlorinus]|uniref:hypothetical protein n=1 Tax=Streptomyces albus TaxID=1888 RepID=UPI001FABA06D|nr:hypothetical protein [Streptomyces albus]
MRHGAPQAPEGADRVHRAEALLGAPQRGTRRGPVGGIGGESGGPGAARREGAVHLLERCFTMSHEP